MADGAMSWQEIALAISEKRKELVLKGQEVSARIEEGGIDPEIYNVISLNFLEISKTCLPEISSNISNLSGLTTLILQGNKLQTVPEAIAKLTKLKQLDLSRNCIDSIPAEIAHLTELQSLSISVNKLVDFPDITGMKNLHIFDISHNNLKNLPSGICTLTYLAHISANANHLEEIPDSLYELTSLKHLDVSDNQLTCIPPELSDCHKLKELNFGGNKLKDRRLAKMMDQCQTKSILNYLRNILEKEKDKGKSGKGGKKDGKKKKKKSGKDDDLEDLSQNLMHVLHFDSHSSGLTVSICPAVGDVRPHIVCCIVRHLNFSKSLNMFKRFITLQTKLHEGVCQRRQAATIATHDLKLVRPPLLYDARTPSDIKLVPLFKHKETCADKLVKKLRDEADEYRKEKKRSTLSGIHQYLDLLKNKAVYAVVVDSQDVVISFPPITNCDLTKVSKETQHILIEVTSSVSLDTCKKVMGEVLQCLLEMGVGENPNAGGDCRSEAVEDEAADQNEASGGVEASPLTTNQVLVVEQVKITDKEGTLKVVYPSRTDLQSEAYKVIRNYD